MLTQEKTESTSLQTYKSVLVQHPWKADVLPYAEGWRVNNIEKKSLMMVTGLGGQDDKTLVVGLIRPRWSW
jgi:hypothetical protein